MAAGKSWKNFVSKDEPEYIYGDGVDQWEFLSGQTTESPRKWLLLEAHPESDSDQVHGNAIIVGDMKLVQIGPTMPAGENGNFLPPGQNKADQKYLLSCGIDIPKDGPANQTECKWPHWCLFNVTADPCEYNNIADSNVQLVANLKLELAKFQATAVPPIEPDGYVCVRASGRACGRECVCVCMCVRVHACACACAYVRDDDACVRGIANGSIFANIYVDDDAY